MMIQGTVEGNAADSVNQFGKIEEATAGQISFLANPKYEEFLYTTKATIIIVNNSQVLKNKVNATLIRVPDAYAAFATLLTKYQEIKTQNLTGIQTPSYIATTAILGEDHFVAAFAHIGENVKMGKNVKIFPNVVVGENVIMGDNVVLHPGVIIYSDCVLGNNIIIHAGAIIGSDGRPGPLASHGSGCQHKLASRDGTRLSSVRHDMKCPQSNLDAFIQL
jgi:UDP-3-O-[3-hydroxymyristoyl] glucosamine N-acyltransferase